ncbi:UspA domain-containing protein [Desulfovibrio sp. X2]|uniref:universal stress protein n=1 Tax=Desulfovibrio sp. X2 TaxID=941449 RepID=UPI000358CC2A|nr:universal stress protein [Desulfovibrio sp. X2]EPR37608.1 UspA domain-containing protein [Desulfovibrio sp. X2]
MTPKTKFKRILLPVDGSSYSMDAAIQAVELARLSGGSIVLLHCHRPVPTALGEPNFQQVTEHYAREAATLLAPFRELLDRSGLSYDDKIVGGPTAEVICEVADLEKCDCIVMGTKGKTGLESLLVGSVTHKVMQLATLPVLVVR